MKMENWYSESGTAPLIDLGDMMLLIQGNFGGHVSNFSPAVTFLSNKHFSHKPKTEHIGQVLWTQSYPQAPNNDTRLLPAWDQSTECLSSKTKRIWHNGATAQLQELYCGVQFTPQRAVSDAWNYRSLVPKTLITAIFTRQATADCYTAGTI